MSQCAQVNCKRSQNHGIIRVGKGFQDHQVHLSAWPTKSHQQATSLSATSSCLLNNPRGRGLRHLPEQPLPVPDLPLHEQILPNAQPKPPLAPLEAMSLHHLRDKTGTIRPQTPLSSCKASPRPPCPQNKQPWIPQPPLTASFPGPPQCLRPSPHVPSISTAFL